MIGVAIAIYISFFTKYSGEHYRVINGLSSRIAKIYCIETIADFFQKLFGEFSLRFTHIDGGCMNQVTCIVFDNFLDSGMIMTNINKSIISL